MNTTATQPFDQDVLIRYALRTVLSREKSLTDFPSEDMHWYITNLVDEFRKGYIQALEYACQIADAPETYAPEALEEGFMREDLEKTLSADIKSL